MFALSNDAISLPVKKDKNNLSMTWLIACGDFGKFWLELLFGTHPPPAAQTAWENIFEANTMMSRILGFVSVHNFTMQLNQSLLVHKKRWFFLHLRLGKGFLCIAWMNWLTLKVNFAVAVLRQKGSKKGSPDHMRL